MVVLPYSVSLKDDGNAMQELFTKAPVTRVVESETRPAVMRPMTQKPTTNFAFTTTTRRSTTQLAMPGDFMATSFKPLPPLPNSFEEMFSTTTEQQRPKSQPTMPADIQAILQDMKIVVPQTQSTTTNTGPVTSDVKDVLQSLGLWEENEAPTVFSQQTLSENFAPIELDFKTGTVRTVEKPTESVNKRMPPPEVEPTDFVAFKPIPKLDKAEIALENYEYFKSLGLLEPSKSTQSPTTSTITTTALPKAIVSKKAQGFTRRQEDVSYETELLKKISKQEREQLLEVLKKLETQVVAGKIGPNPLDNSHNSLTKKDKRQEATTETVEPVKFSFNFNSDDEKTEKDKLPSAEVLSDDFPSLPEDNEGRIVNKGNVTAESGSSDLPTTTSTVAPLDSLDTEDTETFSLPTLTDMDDLKLDNLDDDSGGLDPVADAMPPPEKKNGFYFLADWNSFLEVGEGKDRVEVRFTPRVGDSRLFIPVTVP